ncbi:hypothetical protein Tco_0805666 [Tanacetum coccineum]
MEKLSSLLARLDIESSRTIFVVRAFAYEQFARLLLDYDEDLDLTSEVLPLDYEDIVIDAEENESDKCFNELIIQIYLFPSKKMSLVETQL